MIMSFSHKTQEIINEFAKEQSGYYLDAAEMTYMEKLRRKADQTKQKAGRKLSRFKQKSSHAIEAQNDLILFMSDYINDLISKGLTEQEALAKAREELAASGEAEPNIELRERYQQYFENQDPAIYQAVGLFFGGFLFVGLIIGALIGYIISGGRQEFLSGGWIDTLIGTGAGALLGIGLGEICHAVITVRTVRRK